MSEEGRGNDGIVALLAGLGVGMLIGATAALLMAPRAGEETRAQLRSSMEDGASRLRNTLEETRKKVDELWAARRARQAEGSHAGDVAGETEEAAETA